jgi:hypothetical protein
MIIWIFIWYIYIYTLCRSLYSCILSGHTGPSFLILLVPSLPTQSGIQAFSRWSVTSARGTGGPGVSRRRQPPSLGEAHPQQSVGGEVTHPPCSMVEHSRERGFNIQEAGKVHGRTRHWCHADSMYMSVVYLNEVVSFQEEEHILWLAIMNSSSPILFVTYIRHHFFCL